jgi:hypothetical protein
MSDFGRLPEVRRPVALRYERDAEGFSHIIVVAERQAAVD